MSTWGVSGDVLIGCNCDWGCPCNFNARPSRGYCQGGWILLIDSGRVDEIDLKGLGAAIFAKWPGAIHEGAGPAICFVDDRADTSQRAALTRLVRGELGGPWGLIIRTYNLAPPLAARFDVHMAQHGSRATIGDAVELQLQTIRNPVSQAEVHPEVVLPEGLVLKRGGLAASTVFSGRRRARIRSFGPGRSVRTVRVLVTQRGRRGGAQPLGRPPQLHCYRSTGDPIESGNGHQSRVGTVSRSQREKPGMS